MKWMLDTTVVVAYLADRLLDDLLQAELLQSVVTEMKCLSNPKFDESALKTMGGFLSALRMVELSEPVRTVAVAIRRTRSIKLPYAIMLASAKVGDATLLTNDRQLQLIEGVNVSRVF